MVASYRRIEDAPALVNDYLTDNLSGLNVRLYNYLDPNYRHEVPVYPWDTFEPQWVWIVTVWDDGLDYDADGNAYFDDYPSEIPHSYHLTQRGAEIEAAYLECYGTNANRIRVCQGYQEPYDYDMVLLP